MASTLSTMNLAFLTIPDTFFHDSCGFEAGSNEELAIVQTFVRRLSEERFLEDRLHAIWFAVSSVHNCDC